MKKYLQLLKNIGLFSIASFASKFISFFLLPLYTNYLTTSEYAVIDLALVTQSLLWPIFSCSLTDGLLRFGLDKAYRKDELFSLCSIMVLPGLIICSVIFCITDFGLGFFEYRYFYIAYFIAISLNSFFSIFARTIDRISLIVKNSILTTVLTAVLNIILLVFLRCGIKGYFISLIVANVLSALMFFILGQYRRYVTKNFWNTNLIKQLLRYSIPMIPNSVFWWINSSLDKYCLTAILGLGAAGLYSAAGKISSVLNLVTSIFSQAWGISTASEFDKDSSDLFFSNIYRVYNLAIEVVAGIVIFLSPVLAHVLFGTDFVEAKIFIPVLIMAFCYNAYNIYYGAIFTAYKKTNVIFFTTGAGALANFILNIIFIRWLGIIGAGIATFISNFVVYAVRRKTISKFVNISCNKNAEFLNRVLILLLAICVTFNIKSSIQIVVLLFFFAEIVFFNKDIIMRVVKERV